MVRKVSIFHFFIFNVLGICLFYIVINAQLDLNKSTLEVSDSNQVCPKITHFSNLIIRLWMYSTFCCLMAFIFNLHKLCMLREKLSKSFILSSSAAASQCVCPARRWNSHEHIWILSLLAVQSSFPDRIARVSLFLKREKKGSLHCWPPTMKQMF